MKIKKNIYLIIELFFFCIIILSIYKIIEWKKDMNKSDNIIKEVQENIHINDDMGIEDNKKYIVNFEELKKRNMDVVGWLIVNNVNISYPVLKGKNNSYYLNHDIDGNKTTAGWVFANYLNRADGTDKNLTIFGHALANGSMFGQLKKVLSKEWVDNKNNLELKFISENEEINYIVFSVYKISDEDYFYKSKFENDEFGDFVEKIKSRSFYNFNVEVNENDYLLTLSTCDINSNYRIVLHAKKVVFL